MPVLLKIKRPEDSTHIIWEHIVKSVFAFSGTFALLFFGPMFLFSGSSKGGQESTESALRIIGFLLEHPLLQISICVLIVVVYNINIAKKNSKGHYLVTLTTNNNIAKMGLTNLYYKTITEIEIPIKDLKYNVQTKPSELEGKSTIINFFDHRTGNKIAVLKPYHIIWVNQIKHIKKAIGELNKLGVKGTKSKKSSFSVIGWLFPK